MTKRAEKVSGSVFFHKRRGKCEINYKKKRNFFFSPFGSFFTIFGRYVPGKDDKEAFGGKEKE